jgi:sterol desaturase/sphingolipid hydroxylase (fatty acid hydroxylase superfamily)
VASAGVPREAIDLWRQLLAASISFHHSNLRLPPALDRYLGALIMTPRLHRIHHSARASQRDSNWSSGLTLWDRLHGTYRRDGDAAEITVGVEGTPPAVRLSTALLAPFTVESSRLRTKRKETIDEARTTQTAEPRAQDR